MADGAMKTGGLGAVVSMERLEELRRRDAEIFRRRLAGESPRSICEALSLDTATLEASLRRMVTSINPSYRADLLHLELSRLDEMSKGFFAQACAGDAASAAVILKIMERRARLCGLDAPTQTASRVIAMAESSGGETTTSADRMLRKLREIAGSGDGAADLGLDVLGDRYEGDGEARSEGGLKDASGRAFAGEAGDEAGTPADGVLRALKGLREGGEGEGRGREGAGGGLGSGSRGAEGSSRAGRQDEAGGAADGRPEPSLRPRVRVAGEHDPDRESLRPGEVEVLPPDSVTDSELQNGWDESETKLGRNEGPVEMARPWRGGPVEDV